MLDTACDQVATASSLTNREGEVLKLLAHGRNASHIQKELSISYNTAKTHVKRVYAKLGVHSQQELIDRVECEMSVAEGAASADGTHAA